MSTLDSLSTLDSPVKHLLWIPYKSAKTKDNATKLSAYDPWGLHSTSWMSLGTWVSFGWGRGVYSCTKFILFPPPFLRFLFPSQYFFGQIDHILLLHSNAEVISWFMAFYGIELCLIKTVISKKLPNLWTSYTLYTPTKGWQLIIIETLDSNKKCNLSSTFHFSHPPPT